MPSTGRWRSPRHTTPTGPAPTPSSCSSATAPRPSRAHRVSADVAHAALKGEPDAFGPVPSDRFRSGRHESEYFDPDRPVDKTEDDARWAAPIASAAVAAVADVVG